MFFSTGKLKIVFPLIKGSDQDSTFSIAGLSLPNSDFTGCDEEEIAAALGCVAHVLRLLARWFDVPLRYPIVFLCSRSLILDEIAHGGSPRCAKLNFGSYFFSQFQTNRFPLFSRGVDRARFEYGVYLLNKNLEQLLQSQGCLALNLKQTLPNLATFMNNQLRSSVLPANAPLNVSASLSVLPANPYLGSAPASSPPLGSSLIRVASTTPPHAIRLRRDSPSRRSAPQAMLPTFSPPRKLSRQPVYPSQNGGGGGAT